MLRRTGSLGGFQRRCLRRAPRLRNEIVFCLGFGTGFPGQNPARARGLGIGLLVLIEIDGPVAGEFLAAEEGCS